MTRRNARWATITGTADRTSRRVAGDRAVRRRNGGPARLTGTHRRADVADGTVRRG